jgi:hypothetical protein
MLPTGVGIGDEAEAQTVPYILGIPHPTGFPAFVLVGWLFSHAVPFSTVAWRIDALMALCTALSAAGVVLLTVAIGGDVFAATFAGCAFAFGTTVWNGALHANSQVLAETLALYSLLASVIYARSGNHRALIAAGACCGFGVATHPAAIWVLPAIGVALIWQRGTLTRRAFATAGALFALPMLFYAYLPLRSVIVAANGLDPTTAAPLHLIGGFDWDSHAPRTLAGFLDEVLSRKSRAAYSVEYAADPRALPEAATLWLKLVSAQYPSGLLFLAVVGFLALAITNRRALSVVGIAALGAIAFAHAYRLDSHLDRYLFLSFAITAALAGASGQLPLPKVPANGVRIAVGLALALTVAFTLTQNRPRTTSRRFEDGEAIIAAVRSETPKKAVIVAQWNDAAALGYGAFVEHALDARTIVAANPNEYSDRYERWSLSKPVIVLVSPVAEQQLLPMWANLREVQTSLPMYRMFAVVPPRPQRHRRSARA